MTAVEPKRNSNKTKNCKVVMRLVA